jgi:hypothetical protein
MKLPYNGKITALFFLFARQLSTILKENLNSEYCLPQNAPPCGSVFFASDFKATEI